MPGKAEENGIKPIPRSSRKLPGDGRKPTPRRPGKLPGDGRKPIPRGSRKYGEDITTTPSSREGKPRRSPMSMERVKHIVDSISIDFWCYRKDGVSMSKTWKDIDDAIKGLENIREEIEVKNHDR